MARRLLGEGFFTRSTVCGRCWPGGPVVGAGSEISEGGCSVWDHSVRLAVCVRADFTIMTRVNGCLCWFCGDCTTAKMAVESGWVRGGG